MKKVQIVFGGILLCLVVVVLNSCTPIPIVTIEWQEDGNGFIQFQTNDPENASQGFHILYSSTDYNPMTILEPVEVIVNKVVGSVGGGYGIVFCAFDDQNYYKILISRAGVYKISKVIGGTDNVIREWDYPVNATIYSGLDKPNKIQVARQHPAGSFTVSLNNVQEPTFVDTTLIGGRSGFYVNVSDVSSEYFPASMVDVRFQMLSPDTIP